MLELEESHGLFVAWFHRASNKKKGWFAYKTGGTGFIPRQLGRCSDNLAEFILVLERLLKLKR